MRILYNNKTPLRPTGIRSAFTLLELLIVLALVVALAAVTVGAFSDRASTQSLRRLADDFRGLFGHLRLRAMEEGRIYQFALRPETGEYQIFQPALQTNVANQQTAPSPPRFNGDLLFGPKQLEGEIIFMLDESTVVPESAFRSNLQTQGWRVFQFKPDGTSDDIEFTLRTPDAFELSIHLHGRTSRVTVHGPSRSQTSTPNAGGLRP